ncbi:MAG: alpha/beta hydrolase [Phycisphaeraceae bacterium]
MPPILHLPDNAKQPAPRLDALRRMQLAMGPLPEGTRRLAPLWDVLEEHRDRDVVRRNVRFAVERDGRGKVTDWCSAWWLEAAQAPGGDRERPAMLCLHQTTRVGKDEPAGLAGREDLHYALELARQGFVCLAPDYPRYNSYTTDPYALGYASATMKGIWNHSVALDVLIRLPDVDAARVGCIGHSLGAHNALFLAAFDPRVAAVVSSCGFNAFAWNDNEGRGEPGDLSDWSHRGYMPWIAERFHRRAENMPFDFDDVLASIAPRPVFINAPLRDFMRIEGVRATLAQVESRFGPGQLEAVHPDCEHSFPEDARRAAYDFLHRHLATPSANRAAGPTAP